MKVNKEVNKKGRGKEMEKWRKVGSSVQTQVKAWIWNADFLSKTYKESFFLFVISHLLNLA